MFLLVTIPTDSVIIEAGIFYQSNPFTPPRWDVAAIVLIEVLAEEACMREKGGFLVICTFSLFAYACTCENLNPVHLCDFICVCEYVTHNFFACLFFPLGLEPACPREG